MVIAQHSCPSPNAKQFTAVLLSVSRKMMKRATSITLFRNIAKAGDKVPPSSVFTWRRKQAALEEL
jgi:hypothetical protein